MAVVLSSEEGTYFSSAIHRSHSGRFSSPSHQTYAASLPQKSRSTTNFNNSISSPSIASSASSPPSSPLTLHAADSLAPSYASTPTSSLSLDSRFDDEDICFPSYDDHSSYYEQIEDLDIATSPHATGGKLAGHDYAVSLTNTTSTSVSGPSTPDITEHALDDTALKVVPTRHVDYLSHCWREEEIWSSWKHIVSKRGAYSNSARLENASWRTWTKSKNKLLTISPEKLNWLKDCDVTWLYGPLQTGTDKSLSVDTPQDTGSCLSKNSSFLQKKKPILKKRTMSEIMLQRSLSASSLVKQAAAAVQAQALDRRARVTAQSDYVAFPFPSRRMSRDNTSALPSVSASSSSGLTSHNGEKKHISFNEQVEQCIALEVKGEDDGGSFATIDDMYDDCESSSDDGAIMMKSSNTIRRLPELKKKKQPVADAQSPAENKTIAMLPSTTLKYRGDTPEPPEQAFTTRNGEQGLWNQPLLSPTLSQETIRPSKTNILLGGEDGEDDDEFDDMVRPSAFMHRKDSIAVTRDRVGELQRTGSSGSLNGSPSGMKRTPSGMFMPYEEDEDDVVSEGLFGKVVDTVNTAKDIAHVIWFNLGRR